MAKILVTGGTGYIGSHTVVELIQSGYEVIIIDSLKNSYIQVLDGIERITGSRPEFIKIDLTDYQSLDMFFNANSDIEGIIHFAALKAVGESVANPIDYYHTNITGLLNLIQCCRKYNINNFVFSSSCTVYGQPDTLPVKETSPVIKPESPYGNTKRICEEILEDCSKAYRLKNISLRYFNPIGAHESANIGELPIGAPNNLVPIVTQVAAGLREKLTVYGNDYPTPDGTCIRDYIHVVDLAKAHVIALRRILENKTKSDCEYFNLGTGNGFSVLQVIESFERNSGMKLNYVIGERRPGDVIEIYADTSFANNELGWRAEESLDSMVSSSWKWQQRLPELYPDL